MESLEPRAALLWVGHAVALAAVAAVVVAVAGRFLPVPSLAAPAVGVGLAGFGAVHALLRHRRFRFELRADALYLERGVLVHVSTVVPYVRVQHVDTRRGPLERATGLASTVVYTAGSRGADVSVPGLTPARANELRDRLRELAIEGEADDAT
ncbi:MAG: PH domain-containing protein [Halobacteriales archaeon]